MEEDRLIIRPKQPRLKGEDGYHTFSIRLPSELLDVIDDMVLSLGYSRNELIRIFLRYAIEHCE